jgi:hypothetical protein
MINNPARPAAMTAENGYIAVQWEDSDDVTRWHIAQDQVHGGIAGSRGHGGWRRCKMTYNTGEMERLEAITCCKTISSLSEANGDAVRFVQLSPQAQDLLSTAGPDCTTPASVLLQQDGSELLPLREAEIYEAPVVPAISIGQVKLPAPIRTLTARRFSELGRLWSKADTRPVPLSTRRAAAGSAKSSI